MLPSARYLSVRVFVSTISVCLAGCAGSPSASGPVAGGQSAGGSGTAGNSNQASSGGGSGGSSASGGTGGRVQPPINGIHVQGNRFVDGGKTVRLLGVNHSGTEFECIQGNGIFDGPSDVSLITPMKAWHINVIRVPLNEDCWLGINGVKPDYGGSAYQQTIASYVKMLRDNGLYVIVELHWNAPGSVSANSQQPMADADHAPAFWSSVAGAFKTDPGILFDLYNEPNIDGGNVTDQSWSCWRDGCPISNWNGFGGSARSAGMQSLVDAIRATGASNVIIAAGLGSAEFLGGWLSHMPRDPISNLAAGFHNYGFNGGCNTETCWQTTIAPVAAQVPLVTGELGDNDCGQSFVQRYFAWADPLGISYLGWTWNTWDCGSGPALITNYDGTPSGLGQAFRDHFPTQ